MYPYSLATSHGMSDNTYIALVDELDQRVSRVAGKGFRVTPFARSEGLSRTVGLGGPGSGTAGVWVKDETRNVAGSHKGRHLMGLAILAEVQNRTGLGAAGARLAIASCGNAALAAAVVARARGEPLDVFIPPDAEPAVVRELERLSATIRVCPRSPGVKGDPCYLAFRAAVGAGAFPFCCQGNENGLTVEGGETLAWEILEATESLDRLFIQVGGGALASACIQGLREARALGVDRRLPKIHAVQTLGAFPLRRAWERLVARIAPVVGVASSAGDEPVARAMSEPSARPAVEEALAYAARHRSEFMWPWETEPKSLAHGILDDETYDWLAVVRGMIESGGYPLVVDEARVAQACAVGRAETGIDVDPTGTAGLAGLLEIAARRELRSEEAVCVLFTGVDRGGLTQRVGSAVSRD